MIVRKIKFRAWTGGKMMYRSLCDRSWYTDSIGGKCIKDAHPMDTSIYKLMQFTGLLDRNGKEVYEGDVVQYKKHDGYLLDDFTGVVTWDLTQLIVSNESSTLYLADVDELQHDVLNHLEVVGNIYENQELLEGNNNEQ